MLDLNFPFPPRSVEKVCRKKNCYNVTPDLNRLRLLQLCTQREHMQKDRGPLEMQTKLPLH